MREILPLKDVPIACTLLRLVTALDLPGFRQKRGLGPSLPLIIPQQVPDQAGLVLRLVTALDLPGFGQKRGLDPSLPMIIPQQVPDLYKKYNSE